jgi:hypothetical protein
MKRFLFILALALGLVLQARAYTLFNSSRSSYQIVVAKDASTTEKYAAKELQTWLKQVGGVNLSIVNERQGTRGKRILVGYNNEVRKLVNAMRPESDDQGFVYGNVEGDIYIYGGKEIGTLYGVYTFLENEMGCRWYTKDCSYSPRKKSYEFTELYDKESPAFESRDLYYYDTFDADWTLRNKTHGRKNTKKTSYGTINVPSEAFWSVHTFNTLVKPDLYFKSHPEYFSLRNGKRTKDQLCLSNKHVLQICIKRIKEVMTKYPYFLIYSVTQNDNKNPCQCEECKRLVKKYGGESGAMIWFVNQVAAAVEKDFPDKYIGTFAYQYTRTAPTKIKPRENVVIRLASIECCFTHPIESCSQNKSFVNDMKAWSSISSHLYIWDYVTTFQQYLLVFPNIGVLKRNLQTFRDNKAIGVMEEGSYDVPGGDFAELKAYLLAKLMWNPDADADAIIEDFITHYYGKAAPYMKQYLDLVNGLVTRNAHLTCQTSIWHGRKVYTDSFINKALSILTKAEKAAETSTIKNRVQLQKIVPAYMQCRVMSKDGVRSGNYKLFKSVAMKNKIDRFAEGGSLKDPKAFYNMMDKIR